MHIRALAAFGAALLGAGGLCQAHAQEPVYGDLGTEGTVSEEGRDLIRPYEPPCDLDSGQCQGTDQTVEEVEPWGAFRQGKERIEGLFTFYRDTETGKLFMELGPEHLDREFIYFSYVHDGSRRDGMRTAGSMQENAVLSMRRRYRHVDVIYENTGYAYDPESPVARSAGANVSSPVLASLKVAALNEAEGRVMVEADELFLTNSLIRLGQSSALGRALGVRPGTLNARKTHVADIRNYQQNTEIVSNYAFDWNNATTPFALSDTVRVQHTFLPMPEDGFTPRRADPRVGYFTERRDELTEMNGNPADDLIQRWRLEKTDPDAAVSAVKDPIVFWIENTTPHEYREIIRRAAMAWNRPFEQAGLLGAIEVRVQPDDAEWDAGDVRYNVIRWLSSPNPSYNGYGPRYVNPRTGEILGADIVLEHASVRRWIETDRLFPGEATPISAAMNGEDAADPHADPDRPNFAGHLDFEHACMAGPSLAEGMAFARLAAALAPGAGEMASEAIVREGLSYLVLHEIGHTLGLTHNMMGAYFADLASLNGEGAGDRPLTASVMDYPGVNVALERTAQGDYFPDQPGPYDQWAIGFAYDPALDRPGARDAHLARSTEPGHVFANDADDMRSPGRGLDPRANVYSLSAQPVAYAGLQTTLAESALERLTELDVEGARSWDDLRQSFDILMSMRLRSANVISRFIGGVYVDRAAPGQAGAADAPFTPVSAAEQRAAIAALGEQVFGQDAFDFPPALVARLQRERRGFDAIARADEPLVHARVRAVQDEALRHMLHPRVLNRLTDSQTYGGDYSPHAMLTDLTDEIFRGDPGSNPNSYRRNLQILYVERLAAAQGASGLENVPQSAVRAQIRRIGRMSHGFDFWMEAETRAHRAHVRDLVRAAL